MYIYRYFVLTNIVFDICSQLLQDSTHDSKRHDEHTKNVTDINRKNRHTASDLD